MKDRVLARWMWSGLTFLLLAGYAVARPVNARYSISPSSVGVALSNAGVQVNESQIEFLSSVSSASEHVQLKLVSLAKLNDDALKAHLRCESNSECLPFYVVLRHLNAVNLPTRFSANTGNPKAHPVKKQGERVVRGGQAATMIYETKDIRIVLPIVCLQNGRRGERIRVASPDRKKIYLAEVVDNGLVKGIL